MSGDYARRIPPRALPVAMAAVVGVLYATGSLLGWGGRAFIAWAEVGAAGAAAVSLLLSSRMPDGVPADGAGSRGGIWRASWRWFGIAAASWFVGALGSALSDGHVRSALSLSVPDLFYLFALVALVTGLVAPIRLPRDAGTWLRYAADTYVCACALFVLGWVALFGGLYHRSGEAPSEFLLELLYPLIDIVFVCGALPFVLGAARGHRRLAWMGYGALTAIAVADLVTTFVRLDGGGPSDDPSDILRLAGLLLLLLVPWTGPAAEPDLPVDDIPPDVEVDGEQCGRMIGPGIAPAAVAAAAALFIAGHSLTGHNGLEPGISIAAGSAALVLIGRLAGLLRENDALRRAVGTGEEHFRALSESINDAVLICDLDATVRYASAGALRTYHYTADELLGRPLNEIIHPEDLPRVQDVFTEFLDEQADDVGPQDALRVSCRLRAADGTWVPTESTISRYSGSDGAPSRLLVTTRDLSEQAALQRQVAHLTFHDGLTGLPNRSYFEERTREVLSRQPSGGRAAVVFVDLDGFTAVNDSDGHAAGDQVLAQAARRLRATVQSDDTVARWGGDEFAVLVQLPPDDGETRATVELAGRLLRVLSVDPYQVGSKHIVLTASVGIAFAGDEEQPDGAGADAGRRVRRSAADLMRNGDLAMARAKELGGGRVEVFAPHMHADVVRRLELGSDLQAALAEEQFSVEFQPVVDLSTSRVTGVEALLRWRRENEAVPPEEFIGPAEESGLMIPLGDWVLREACREVARWRGDAWDVGLSVNFTARQIAAPRFVESVAAALAETGLPPQALTLEVREEVLVEDAGQNVARLSELRDLGVRLAIDDFGTGYASLAYLGQLPVDVIKIDPSFVAGLGSDDTLTLLTRTIVRLGSDLGLTVVAEGIERPEQLELLREMGCPRGQGFLVARPMEARRVESLVRTNLAEQDRPGDVALPLPG
ncbi:putative bifunctional diguanylate cyclase/phosphodiesterase [Actinomadura madurae]|uniref:putative bifunctional diguanylate cyclase/phosphodiesterase n=1 Tax=Actinomadura madurae TaxID=1993 RepID=UPI002026B13A|nr:GGDEF domain-containing phosphodiesterase [Actinomadura madurae]MCP9983528.1 EAL domain-containing protein [Actinomadura madurae]MCQ0019764.1 EAL domain-containing protein [Actinomadura madurae]URM99794.1 EAL domain-containing protein [Actinomadura madurae]